MTFPFKEIFKISRFLALVLVYLVILIFLYFYQRNLLYHPNENNYSGNKLTVAVEEVNIPTADNLNLKGWFHKKDLTNYSLFFSATLH